MNDNVSNTKGFGFAWDLMKALVKLHRKCFLFKGSMSKSL